MIGGREHVAAPAEPEHGLRMSEHEDPLSVVPALLIVVASLQLRSAIRQCLQSIRPDCRYLEAASGEEALGISQVQPADLVLLDLHLPGISAIETIRRLKQTLAATQVVLLAEPYEVAWLTFDPVNGASGSICKDSLYEELDRLVPEYLGPRGTRGSGLPSPRAE